MRARGGHPPGRCPLRTSPFRVAYYALGVVLHVPARHPSREADAHRVLGDDGELLAPTSLSLEERAAAYRTMVRTRVVDRTMERLQRQGRIAFHVPSLGEEAAVVGVAAGLAREDWIVPCYREVGALFHRGYALEAYVDTMLGNTDDVARGRNMPEHTTCRALRYASVSAPIGTQIPHAVGMARAVRHRGLPEVVAVFFGDGATSSNDFHAAMTFAGVFREPVLFVCRNNRWAISLPVEEQTAAVNLAAKAPGYGIAGVRCDGNDLLAVVEVVRAARARALAGGGPTFLELLTYREGGHSTSDDPTQYRDDDEVAAFGAFDPLVRLRRHLVGEGGWDDARDHALVASVEDELREVVARGERKPPPPLASTFDDVFARPSPRLEAQRDELLRGPRDGGAHG